MQILPIKGTKVVWKNKKQQTLFEELRKATDAKNEDDALKVIFGRCAGFVLQEAEFSNDNKKITVVANPPHDFKEGRIARIRVQGIEELFEAKGVGRISRNGDVDAIDAYGPYETGPPGGLFLEFANKYTERSIQLIDHEIKVVDIPLVVVQLPYEFEFKSQKEKISRERKLAIVGRVVLQPIRIDELCHLLKDDRNKTIRIIKQTGKGNLDQYLEFFCSSFGKNLHELIFEAKRTHFALWDGGDVGMCGEIADYDSVHDLNIRDLADTVDGALSTVKRLLCTFEKEQNKFYEKFFSALLGHFFSVKGKLEDVYGEVTEELIEKTMHVKEIKQGILKPKFNNPEHAVYYSQYAIE